MVTKSSENFAPSLILNRNKKRATNDFSIEKGIVFSLEICWKL